MKKPKNFSIKKDITATKNTVKNNLIKDRKIFPRSPTDSSRLNPKIPLKSSSGHLFTISEAYANSKQHITPGTTKNKAQSSVKTILQIST
ncbi:MAG: hypothetical protein ACI4R8_04890 [Candidatus Caccovivens sp.]